MWIYLNIASVTVKCCEFISLEEEYEYLFSEVCKLEEALDPARRQQDAVAADEFSEEQLRPLLENNLAETVQQLIEALGSHIIG